ncbi:MAG: hemerythrin domain-containing protein [Polyangiaceae bacterium]|nr:hemerythrin domain-containing protein [Polyangiaceae bacterium]
MKRDARLRGLSSEHHRALVLARTLRGASASGATRADTFAAELEPHFRIEDEELLSVLALRPDAESQALAKRTAEDHAHLRAEAARAAAGEPVDFVDFASRLEAHVRFEERELFPFVEAQLPDAALDAVHRRAPHD